MQLQLLGAANVFFNGASEPLPLARPSWLLVYLALRGDWVARDELACLFRPEDDDETARNALRLIFHRAKQFPWAANLEVEAKRARFLIKTDIEDFANRCQHKNWLEALELYKGGLLEGFTPPALAGLEAWLDFERERLHGLWREAILHRVAELESTREYGVAIAWLEKLLHLEPISESATQALMRCYLAQKNRVEAEKVFKRFSNFLQIEVGSLPDASTTALLDSVAVHTSVEITHGFLPIIGRESELEQLKIWLIGIHRLVSVVGIGGTGKTRLALEAARLLRPEFAHGTVFIDGTALSHANQLVTAIAAALNTPSQNAKNLEQTVLVFLKEKAMLLVLDNMEHLLETTSFIGQLLTACEHIRVLVTSRVRLGMSDETILDLLGLPIPKNTLEIPTNQAMRLFSQVAGRLTKQSLEPELVAKIVQRLEGLPLAIELAARWTRILSVQQILTELEKSQLWLETDTTDVPERHRSLQSVLHSTWAQLMPREKQALEALSVFRGGATLEALQAVGQTQLPTLLALMNKGLIHRDELNRFSCHEMIREFAQTNSAIHLDLQERHAIYFAELCRHWKQSSRQPATFQTMDLERPNIHLAFLYWAQYQQQTLEENLQLIAQYWDMRGLGSTALDYLASYSTKNGSSLEGRTNFWRGSFLRVTSDYPNALKILELSAKQLAQVDLTEESGRAWLYVGFIFFEQANFLETEKAVRKAQNCFQLDTNLAESYSLLGAVAKRQLNYRDALVHYTQAREIQARLNNILGLGTVLNNIANIHEVLNEDTAAFETYQQCLEIFTKMGHQRPIAVLHSNLGFLATKLKQFESAREHLNTSLEIRKIIGDQAGEVTVLTNLAALGVAIKNAHLVTQSLRTALSLALQLNFIPRALDAFKVLGEWYIESNPMLASRILQTVFEHPSTSAETKQTTQNLLDNLQILGNPLSLDQWQSALL